MINSLLNEWARAMEEYAFGSTEPFASLREEQERAVSIQAERYEAAINPNYPEPEEEPERKITFKRPIPFAEVSNDKQDF